jgi:23S rRNA G2445 N2-methylase RlmL
MELDSSKKVTNGVVLIAEKTAQKESSVLIKMPIRVAQLLNTASCSSEVDLFVEMQKQQWHCSISEQSGVQDDTVNCVEEVGS